MLTLTIVLVLATTLVLTVVRPKWATGLVWLTLFTYPHNWWFNHPILPLNIGVDDLLCVVLFVAVVVRRNLFAGIRVRRGYAFWTITAFLLVATIANLSGALEAPFERVLYGKDILKLCVVWGLFYAVLHCIDDADDLRRQLTMFSIAAAAGGVLVVLHHVLPGSMQAWSNPSFLEIQEVTGRASGAFLNPNGAACVLACSLVLVVTAVQLQGLWPAKGLLGLSCVLLLLGVSVTQSRSGFAALAGTFGLMALIGRNRRIAWTILACAFLVVTFAGVRQALEARMATVYDPAARTWDRNLAGRAESWHRYFETATPKVILLGQGQRGGITRNGSESHSAYVSTLTVYGVGGLVWAIVSLVGFWRKARTGPEDEDARTLLVKSGCLWAFVAWAIYAATSDAISSQYPRYLLFYLVVLVDRASAIAKETALVQAYWDQIMENAVKPIDAVARVSAES
ncbi:MAG: O-antigen ligase family protein [Phycisphaerae bacterium]|nr:O-antigen ligase family protein [Phycisphaerae bacterium]